MEEYNYSTEFQFLLLLELMGLNYQPKAKLKLVMIKQLVPLPIIVSKLLQLKYHSVQMKLVQPKLINQN